jgi:polysaccharide export outer membrane protein
MRKFLVSAGIGLHLALLIGCTSAYIPKDASIAAPNAVIQLKKKYESISIDDVSVDTQVVRSNQTTPPAKKKVGSYILGPGDQLTIVIQLVPGATYDVTIRPDGFISLPMIDEVEAFGLTAAQLDDRLTERYSERLVEPDLTVIVQSFRLPMVYVVGKVANPGPIPFREAASAAEAIARAGDMLPSADDTKVTIIRLDKDGNIKPILVQSTLGDDADHFQVTSYLMLSATKLEPEDVLFVPEHGASYIGTNIELTLKPVTAIGNAATSILSPVLIWKYLEVLEEGSRVIIGP